MYTATYCIIVIAPQFHCVVSHPKDAEDVGLTLAIACYSRGCFELICMYLSAY